MMMLVLASVSPLVHHSLYKAREAVRMNEGRDIYLFHFFIMPLTFLLRMCVMCGAMI
jgi:hypothetical protein